MFSLKRRKQSKSDENAEKNSRKSSDETENREDNESKSTFNILENALSFDIGEETKKCADFVEGITENVEENIQKVSNEVSEIKDSAVEAINFVEDGFDNVLKFKKECQNVYNLAFKYKGYIESENLLESTLALTIWIVVCYFFQFWMIPVGILIYYIKKKICEGIYGKPEENEEERTLLTAVQEKQEAVQEVMSFVQNLLGLVEYSLRKVSKLFSITWIAIGLQLGISLLLIYIPINYFLILYGLSLYFKKFLRNSPKVDENGVLINS